MVLVPENTLERLQQRQEILTPLVTQTPVKNLMMNKKLGFTIKCCSGT